MATSPIHSLHRSAGHHAAEEARRKLLEDQAGQNLQNVQAPPSLSPSINLFDKTTYDTKTAPTDGTSTQQTPSSLPDFSDEEKTQINTLIDSIPDDQKASVNAAGIALAQSVWSSLGMTTSPTTPAAVPSSSAPGSVAAAPLGGAPAIKAVAVNQAAGAVGQANPFASKSVSGSSVTVGQATVSQASPDVQNAFNNTAIALNQAAPTDDYDSAVTRTALVGVMGLQGSLKTFAADMQQNINKEATLRTDSSELQQMADAWPAGTDTQSVTYHKIADDGSLTVVTENLTKQQAADAADSAKNAVSTLSDATQTQYLQLQSLEQNYQQGVTTISNVMRTSYDMVKNTIQNIHY